MKSRRKFLQEMAALGLTIPVSSMAREVSFPEISLNEKQKPGPLCVFSKHLQFLDYEEMADAAAEIGFDGVDIPVRPGGHVLPENVERDLPKAVRAVEKAGLRVPMITTAISDADDERTIAILETAASLGVRYYRPNWFGYDFEKGIIPSLDFWKKRVEKLAELNRKSGINASYQNHAGLHVGAAIWDLWYMLNDVDPRAFGIQYDIRHATAEGGLSWPVTLQLVTPLISTLVVKDFYWGKRNGEWKLINVPLGKGMVDFKKYFQSVVKLGIGGPVSVHFEYPMTDRPADELSKKEEKRQVVANMKRDLNTLRSYLSEAGL